MANTLHDNSTSKRQPNSLFDRAESYQRENGSAMLWTVFVERDGHPEHAGTAYELSTGEIILPTIPASGRVLLKHNFRGA